MIEFEGVSFSYPGASRPALRGIDLCIEREEFVLLTGRSGSGKTTMLRCMNGLVPHFYGGRFSGSVRIDGFDTKDHQVRELSRHVGLVFQDPENQFATTSVRSEMEFGMGNVENGGDLDDTVRQLAARFGLLEILDRPPSEISGGEKQKAIIASVAGMGTGALALDEPSSQLDPVSAAQILDLLAELNRGGMAIVLSEHRLEKAIELATRCLVLDSGRVIFDGPAEGLQGSFPEFFHLKRPYPCSRGSKARKILVEDLAFAYPGRPERVLDGLSLAVGESEVLGVLAENGGGKSTLSEILTGLLSPYSGRIEIDGTALNSIRSSKLSRLIGIVFQDPNIHLFHETVREEIEFAPRNMDLLDPATIDWVIELFGLGELQQRNPRDLSGGQKEKVAIASVASYLPQVLILDEPTRGLDTLEKAGVMEGICELRRRKGTTVIIPTHDLQLLETYADRVVVLRGGRTVFEGEPAEAVKCFAEGLRCRG